MHEQGSHQLRRRRRTVHTHTGQEEEEEEKKTIPGTEQLIRRVSRPRHGQTMVPRQTVTGGRETPGPSTRSGVPDEPQRFRMMRSVLFVVTVVIITSSSSTLIVTS
uniref:Uncharacterized protein n=1 Tax=Anopheles farauti TaxID=69004 RepID=A0A182QBL3_9DIPT